MNPGTIAFRAGVFAAKLLIIPLLSVIPSTQAGLVTWDIVDNGPSITEGSGIWNASTPNWNTGSGSTTYTGGSDVIFGAGGSGTDSHTVTFGQALSASSLTFNPGARYNIAYASGSHVLTMNNGTITANVDALIGVAITSSSGLVVVGPGTVTFNGSERVIAQTITVGSATSGGHVLAKGGDNTLFANELKIVHPDSVVTVQGSANDQIKNDGLVTISAGTLNIDLTGSKTEVIGNLNMSGGTINGNKLAVNPSGSIEVSGGTINASLVNFNTTGATLNKNGNGTFTLGGDNTAVKGAVKVNAGTLQIGGGGSSGTLPHSTMVATVASGATLAFNRSDSSLSVANKITGAGKVENKGTGTVTLTGNNDYTGGTTLTAGTLVVGTTTALPTSGQVNFNGGALRLNNGTALNIMVGTLTLAADSSLYLDSANSTHGSITFTGASRTGGTLAIRGWLGQIGQSGTDDRVLFTTAPTSDFLSHVQFLNASGEMVGAGGEMLGNEMVPSAQPVPEPTNIALAVFGGTLICFRVAGRLKRRC